MERSRVGEWWRELAREGGKGRRMCECMCMCVCECMGVGEREGRVVGWERGWERG